MAELRFSEHAERDLVDIGDLIARDNPVNAAHCGGFVGWAERSEAHRYDHHEDTKATKTGRSSWPSWLRGFDAVQS